MAIAGAAFSPSMGRMTKAPVRFLMARCNLRLGVWLPNPRCTWVREQVQRPDPELRTWSRPCYLFFEMFGRIVVVKLGLNGTEPVDLLDYQRRNPIFPYDSTANQLYTAERFDAYRALGFATTSRAVEAVP
jgi:hypothetical protein